MSRGPRTPEKIVQRHIVNLLRSIGGEVYELGTRRPRGDFPGTRQTPGISDLYAFLPDSRGPGPDGAFSSACALWVEVKAEGGRLRPEQADFRARCLGAGVPHIVGGVDAVIAWLIAGGWLRSDQVAHYRLGEAS